MTGHDTIDFTDIDPTTAQAASYSGDTSGGTLSVTDGTHTANIALLGNYLASAFVASSDGHAHVQSLAAGRRHVRAQPECRQRIVEKPCRFDDVPELDIHLLDRPLPDANAPSAGAGETPIIVIAPAIANAVFNATGKRVRKLPITPDKLI